MYFIVQWAIKNKKRTKFKKRSSLNPNCLSNSKLFLISSALNYVPRDFVPYMSQVRRCLYLLYVPSFFQVSYVPSFFYVPYVPSVIYVLYMFSFFYMPLVPSLFLRAFFFYIFYILFMYTLIKLTQINGFTYDCSSLLLLKSLNVQ